MSLTEEIDALLRQKRENYPSWTEDKQKHLLELMLREQPKLFSRARK